MKICATPVLTSKFLNICTLIRTLIIAQQEQYMTRTSQDVDTVVVTHTLD